MPLAVQVVVTSCQPVAGSKYVNLCFYCHASDQCLHQHRSEIRPATGWQVVGHYKETTVQITAVLSFSCERIPKIMSLSPMRLATSHQSVARPKYVPPISIYCLIYADLYVGFCKQIQHAS